MPGAAHFFVFWAFLILASVYLEAYGSLFDPGFAIPFIGHWAVLGFLQDFIAVMALVGIATFTIIRIRQSPERLGRKSRFKGSHLGGAWLVLFMIFNVIWSMFLFRGASVNTGNFPYDNGAFMSEAVGSLLEPLGESANEVLENVGLLLHIGVMLTFLIIVLNSKHLHIFVAPLNVMFKRKTDVALGDVKPLMVAGKPIDFENIEDLDEDASLGVGSIEDFSWKGMLDFATCIGGIGAACRALDFPVVSGNVSLYNETNGHAILPTPTIGGVGLIDHWRRTATLSFKSGGETILLAGAPPNWGTISASRSICGNSRPRRGCAAAGRPRA